MTTPTIATTGHDGAPVIIVSGRHIDISGGDDPDHERETERDLAMLEDAEADWYDDAGIEGEIDPDPGW